MFRKILAYISTIAVIIATSCSDDFNVPESNGIGPDGEVVFTLDIPALTTVKTRAEDPEFQVNDIAVLIYNAENTVPAQFEHIYLASGINENNNKLTELPENKLQLSFKIEKNIRNSNLTFYFIANPANVDTKLKTLTINDLKESTVNYVFQSELLTMCGTTLSNNGIIQDSPVPLFRNAVKITVAVGDNENTEARPFQVFGMAEESVLLAGLEKSLSPALKVKSFPDDIENTDATYCHPTQNVKNQNDILGNIYVITKAAFDGKEYYYRMDFCNKNADTIDFLDAESNHWYQFIIQEVNGAGYLTPEEASLHPDSDIVYEIHDHSPVSYNMISDGIRELGVSHKIDYDGSGQAYLYIKVFSKIDEEMDKPLNKLSYTSEASWLAFDEIEEVSDEEYIGSDGIDDDKNNPGKIYRVPLKFSVGSGNISTDIVVDWMGLKRTVPVELNLSFNGAQTSSASLTIIYNGQTTIDDYWAFLASTDNENPYGNNLLWGVQEDNNNGKIRNQGFHFPVMYGESGNLATYSYSLAFDKDEKFNNVKDVIIRYTDNNVTITNNGDNKTFTITRNNNDQYRYLTGKINFVFSFNDGTSEIYSFDTYHTGFFHKDDNEFRLDIEGKDNDYYYYEVVPVEVDGKPRYLLDRNLAAKSAQDYIRNVDGSIVTGNDNAAGGYFYVAHQETAYEDPVMYNVSPPGYSIPNKNEWGAIRTSTLFHTEYDGSLYPAYYETSVGRIYFPKAMMYLNGNHTGEGRAGYYWTSTASSGSEKDEIGRWLNMLVMAGSTTTYYNGYVLVGDNTSAAYGCSVRCINRSNETEGIVKRTHFMVAGATHVYLYTFDNEGNRISPMTWPGQSVFNFATASPSAWTGFEYSSFQFYPEDMYVIFNFVEENGIIHTFSKGTDGNTVYTDNVAPSACLGWKMIGDDAKDIIPSGSISADGTPLSPAQQTSLGNWWQCDKDNRSVNDYKRDIYLYLIGDVFSNHSNWTPNDGLPVKASPYNDAIFIW